MQINKTFDGCIGQESVKATLSLYIDAFAQTGRLPFINLTAGKGGGKSFFARQFREGLLRKDGSRQPMLEVNCASIKNARQFFEQVYPTWVAHKALLFLDEIHNLPKDLEQMFLSILDVRQAPIRNVDYNGIPYDFNF